MPTQKSAAAIAPGASRPLRGASQNLSEQLAAALAQTLQLRLMGAGARLPSVRDAARRHGVSTATVVAAYDRLQAQGLIEARPQRGFFVRETRPVAAQPAVAARPADPGSGPPPVDATALIRGMFRPVNSPLSPGIGTLPESWLDAPLLQRALRRVCSPSHAQGWLSYGDPAGDHGLRSALSRRANDIGVPAPADQIVTTVGATHGLDIVSRALLQLGDAVLVDEPGWAVEFARLQRLGVRILPVVRGNEGPDLAQLETLCREHRPRLYVTVSVLHNPTGASLSAASAHRVLQLAEAYDLTIVEDDSYGWLAPPHAIRLSALDGLRRTVLVSGFSKILTPQWRVGWVAAPATLVERLVDTGVDTDRLALALHEQGWLIAPGSLFNAQRQPGTLMRINFSCTHDLRFWRLFEGMRTRI